MIFAKFKDFEIRQTTYLDGHIEPGEFEVVKWYDHESWEVFDLRTGTKKISTGSCFVIAHISWNNRESGWDFKSVGTRFIDDYENGLCEYIKEFLELVKCVQRLTEDE